MFASGLRRSALSHSGDSLDFYKNKAKDDILVRDSGVVDQMTSLHKQMHNPKGPSVARCT